MLGLAILFIFGVYVAISIGVTWYATAWARKRGRRAWLWGCVAAFAMYNVMFWDLVPTLVMHEYYCSTQAGFWPYVTFEEWERENPGVVETLNSRLKPSEEEQRAHPLAAGADRYWYNVRFYKDSIRAEKIGTLVKIEVQFVDSETNTAISSVVTFYRGLPPNTLAAGGTPEEIRKSLVLGSGDRECVIDKKSIMRMFREYNFTFWKSGENK